MAKRTIESEIKLSGEQEYRKALSEINGGLSTLNSEMRKTTAQYQDNANSTDALRAKGELLERQLYSQKEKVETLRKALADSAEKYGEADSRTQKWQRQLNDAEAQLYNTESAIRKNNQAMTEGEQTGGKLSSMVSQLTEKFGSSLPSGLKTSLESFGSFSSGAIIALGATAAAVKALIDVEKQLIDMTTEAAAKADAILTDAVKSGLSTERIQQMRYSAELLDVSYETIAGSLTKIKKNMSDARNENSAAAEAFSALGVAVMAADGNLRSAEDVFYDAIDALGEIENATERDATAMTIFGKSAEELNPIIDAGTDAMREYAREAEEVGYVLNETELEALGNVDNAYQRLQNSQEAVRNHLAAEFAPSMENVYKRWQEWTLTVGQAIDDSKIVPSLGTMLDCTMAIIDPLVQIVNEILPPLRYVLEPIAGMFAWIADSVEVIAGMLTRDFGRIGTALGFGASSGQLSHMQQWMYGGNNGNNIGWTYNSSTGLWEGNGHNSSGDMNYRGGATWVGENGPELVSLPSGSSISNAQESRRFGGNVFNITIDARNVQEFNDIVRLCREAPMTARMGG